MNKSNDEFLFVDIGGKTDKHYDGNVGQKTKHGYAGHHGHGDLQNMKPTSLWSMIFGEALEAGRQVEPTILPPRTSGEPITPQRIPTPLGMSIGLENYGIGGGLGTSRSLQYPRYGN